MRRKKAAYGKLGEIKEGLPVKRKRIRGLAVVLSLCLAVILPVSGSAAQLVDVSRMCSLTIYPFDPDSMDDQGNAGDQETADQKEQRLELTYDQVAVDIYKVADASANHGYDGYGYEMLTPYRELNVGSDIDPDGWKALALEAAEIALLQGGLEPVSAEAAVRQELESGLYLLIARGKDLENADDYIVKSVRTVAGTDGQTITEEYISGTIANSRGYVYTFTPVLVSVPGKDPDADGEIHTANRGDWLYDMEVVLKPEQKPRYGPLTIIKTLLSYETDGTAEPVMVVFDIEARLKGELVYSDVAVLTFTGAGQDRIVIEDKIPVGAVVTVTERYGGPGYVLDPDDEPEKTVVVRDAEGESVAFINRYDGSDRDGHGITNNFVYEEIGGGILGWNWTQIPSLQEGEDVRREGNKP